MTLSRLLSQQQPVPIQMKHLLKCPGATAESKSLAFTDAESLLVTVHSSLPDFSSASFRNEAYLDLIPKDSVKLSSTGNTV